MATTVKLEQMPQMSGLEFDEVTHTYRFNGMIVPSVTQILEPLNRVKYEGINESTLDRAADRGTEVHDAIEFWLKFGMVDISQERRPYFDAFIKWWDGHSVKVIGSENRLYHKILLYGGTADLIAYVDGKLTLVDYKTTSVISDMTCGPQLEAYSQACASHGVRIERKAILQLKKDSTFVWKEYPAKDIRCWTTFSALKTVYDYIKTC